MEKIGAPAWFYGPEGQAKIFTDLSDVPAGWQDHPFKVDEVAPAETPSTLAPALQKRGRKPELLDL